MKKIFIVVPILVLIAVGFIFKDRLVLQKHEAIHYHAGFKVFVDGVFHDFSDIKYMSLTPCGEHQETNDPAFEQVEKAHLHDSIGTVVHVHRDGALWKDLFQNLNFTIDVQKQVRGFINGQETTDILNHPIVAHDSIIILLGTHEDLETYIGQATTRTEIETAEQQSELCG